MQVSPELQLSRSAAGGSSDCPAVLIPEQQVLFAGTPPSCAGYVVLHNCARRRVRARYLYLRCDAKYLFDAVECVDEPILTNEGDSDESADEPSDGERSKGQENAGPPLVAGEGSIVAEEVPPVRLLSIRAKLLAGESRELRVEIPISLTAPPGTYTATLMDPSGPSCPATIQVHERRATRVHPSVVPCSASRGQVLSLEVHVKNVGNVVSHLAPGVAIRLSSGDENWHRHFHRSVARFGSQGHQQVLDRFVETLGESEHSPLKGRLTRGAGELAPGEGRLVNLEFTVPNTLPARRYFNAALRLGDGALTLSLYITPSDHEDSVESTPVEEIS